MDASILSKYIEQPEQVDETNLKALKKAINQYPYCGSLYLLYIKGLTNSNSLHFEEFLKKASIHVNDREKLFNIINQPIIELSTVELEKVNDRELNEIENKQITKEKLKEEIIEEPILIKENQIEKPIDVISNKLEERILTNAIEDALIFDIENLAYKSTNEELKVEPSSLTEPLEIEISNAPDLLESSDNSEILLELNETDHQAQKVDVSSMSFTEWLKYKQTGKVESNSEQEISSSKETITTKEIQVKKEPKLTKKEINHLLDKFLQEEPKISRPKKDFYNPVKNAKKSLEETDVLMSETLAKIYHLQKNYSKAIKAYEQLSLLNPKKKSFFANQIKKIKKEEQK